jgi:hypothetical protein
VVLDKEFQHLAILRERQEWTRLTILTPDLATGRQQASLDLVTIEVDSDDNFDIAFSSETS